MEAVTVLLPHPVSELLVAEAKRQNVGVATLCSGIVVEHVLANMPNKRGLSSTAPRNPQDSESFSAFDIRKSFPNFPTLSIELAQQFVNEALRIPGTRAFKTERGVGFEPNFVFVEYLQKRQPGGIGVSFYGRPSDLRNGRLLEGRNSNYSRSIARSLEELKPLLQNIRRSYELKFGRLPRKS